jgi:hypothetical protein
VGSGLLHCRFAASATYNTSIGTGLAVKVFHFSLFLAAALEHNAGFAYNGAYFIDHRPKP